MTGPARPPDSAADDYVARRRGGAPAPAARPAWSPTKALRRAVISVGVLTGLGVFTGRLDLVLLAVPFIVGTVAALRTRPGPAPEVTVAVGDPVSAEGGWMRAELRVANRSAVALTTIVARAGVSRWIRLRQGYGTFAATGEPNAVAAVRMDGRLERWGVHGIGPVFVTSYACDNLLVAQTAKANSHRFRVYPVNEPFDADEAMPRAAGLGGTHRSRRPGDGGELAGVRPYQPGDRLRRIDWRVSLRARELYVNHTLSDRDAEVVLLLDVGHEAGVSGGVDGAPTVMDTTVRAAASIAEHYLHRGDRVSCVEYGRRIRRLPAGSGQRHYVSVLEFLLASEVSEAAQAGGERLLSTGGIPPKALVIMFTPLLDDRAVSALAGLARAGRFLIAIDTLPAHVRPELLSRWSGVAERLWRLERANAVGELREHGVPVVAWTGSGSLDEVLRDVTRMSHATKALI